MKNLLLLLTILATNSAFGTPCTTAVGSAHVIATCALGNRTFSAFAPTPAAPKVIGGQGQAGGSQPEVLVPFTQWVQRTDGPTVAPAILERVGAATPERADHGLHISRTAVSGALNIIEEPGQTLAIGGAGLDLVLSDKTGSDWKSDGERDSNETLMFIFPPAQGDEEDGSDRPGTSVISLDETHPTDDFTETPEPATYALIGAGLIGLWGLRRRTVRRPDRD